MIHESWVWGWAKLSRAVAANGKSLNRYRLVRQGNFTFQDRRLGNSGWAKNLSVYMRSATGR